MRLIGKRLRAFTVAAVSACALLPMSADAFEPRVPEGYFGISAPELTSFARDTDPRLALGADGVRAAGLDFVRATVDWRQIEPLPSVLGVHSYDWAATDRLMRALAIRDLELVPNLSGTPTWARALDAAMCGTGGAVAELQAPAFGDLAEAMVRRYGTGGDFWAANPDLQSKPVRRVEVWNEPNWTGSWCPRPQPERFAPLMLEAAQGIRAADPSVEIVLGGLVITKEDLYFSSGGMRGMATGRFLQAMVAARPALTGLIDSVAVHLYDADPDVNVSNLAWIRARLDEVGLAGAGIFVSEFGWHTAGDAEALSEEARAEAYHALVDQLPRTDCDVDGLAAHNWFSQESDPDESEDWFGLADPGTGALYPAGEAYRDALAVFEGRGSAPAPRTIIGACGRPAPDQDGDGTPDVDDDYPLDPDRDTGSGEAPPAEEPEEEPDREPLVDSRFYSVTSALMPSDPELRKLHYDAMESIGVSSVRQSIQWDHVEPVNGAPASSRFAWTDTDRRIVAYAKRGISTSLAPHHAPVWTPTSPGSADARLADLLTALAERYGNDGVLWDENRHLDGALAPQDYEIWTDANLDSSAWDGSADPAEYASIYTTGRSAIRAVDPSARAIVSLIDGGDGAEAAAFIREMVDAKPQLAGNIDGVYVMGFGARSPEALDSLVAKVRFALEDSGNPDARLRIGFGAPTSGPGAMSEGARAEFVEEAASRLPRLDCGVDEAVLYAWSSAQSDPGNAWDWYGVSDLADGTPSATAVAFAETARAVTGYGGDVPERGALHPCMREPLDRDGDGTPDSVDPAPLDPDVSTPEALPPPAPSIDEGPQSFSGDRSAEISFSAPGATEFNCRLDGQPWAPCSSSWRGSGLADGVHVFDVRAIDALGLIGPPTGFEWTVDTKAPETTIDSGPSGLIQTDQAEFELASDEPGATFVCRLDSKPWEPCDATTVFTGLGDGNHSFVAAAIDRAGNPDASHASRFFEVRTLPGVPGIQANGLETQTPTFTFSANFAASFECRFDGSAFAPCSGAGRHTPARPLQAGRHRFEVRGVGPTGKLGQVAGWTFSTSDTDPPETTIVSGPDGPVPLGPVEFHLESNEDGVVFWCRLDGLAWTPCGAVASFADLLEGEHEFQAVTVDSTGKTDPTPARSDFSLTVDRLAPVLNLSAPRPSPDKTPTVEFEVTDDVGVETVECEVDGGAWVTCASPYTTPKLKPGRHQVAVRALDAARNEAIRSVEVKVKRKKKKRRR